MTFHLILDRTLQNASIKHRGMTTDAVQFAVRGKTFLKAASIGLSIQTIASVALLILFPNPITVSYAVLCGASILAARIAKTSSLLPPDNLGWFGRTFVG